MSRFLQISAFLFASQVLGAGSVSAEEFEIYTCRDEQGNVSMQNDPCPEIPEKKAAPRTPTPQRKQAVAPPRQKPQPRPKPKPQPKPAASRQLDRSETQWIRLKSTPSTTSTTGPRRFGKQTFPTRLDDAAQPSSPSFSSPARTWRTFLAAIESGDSTGALACLTADARESLGADAETFPLEEIRSMVGKFVRIEDEGDLGPFWSIYAARAGQQPKWIFFEQVAGGAWKIAAI